MSEIITIALGFVLGGMAAAVAAWLIMRQRRAHDVRTLEESQRAREREMSVLLDQIKLSFAALSREALSANTDDFLKRATPVLEQQTKLNDQVLDAKKKLIDARLEDMNSTLRRVGDLVTSAEKQRAETDGSLKSHIQVTQRLQQTTAQLREALANPQRRGQWGERMAEDVLRLAGFMEGVNYVKQRQLDDGGKPDFTFLLPGNHRVHMDVKFPLQNYLKVLDAADDASRSACTDQFLRDVRARIKEVASRAYIDPAAGTVDYALVFIPNEQVYGFIHASDAALLDNALRNKIVLCSPLTLYAILAVIRQATDNFRFEQGSREILNLLAEFKKQWEKYVESMDRMGASLEKAGEIYQDLVGVRTRKLDRQLERIDDLRAAQGALPGERLDVEATVGQSNELSSP